MKETDIVKAALKARGWQQETLASACGYKTQSAIGNRLQGDSMKVSTFVKLLSAMGYEVIVRSVDPSVPACEWRVDEK